jgi:hypothetical protein
MAENAQTVVRLAGETPAAASSPEAESKFNASKVEPSTPED